MNRLQRDGVYLSTRPSYAHQNKFFLILLAIISLISISPAHAEEFKATGTIDAYFSPHGGCTEAIVKELTNAKTEILAQAYSFTSKPIAKALVDAKKRGIKIEVILDKSQRSQKYSSADFIAHAGIPTYIDSAHAIAHNKIMLIDRSTVITGSFNFTKAAEKNNAENLLIIKGNNPLEGRYIQNFNEHKGHSERYVGR
jgi:phosphatidylserine/phosphatidylglycerophosphate/cardiolipin synthase-like enzyme